MKVLSERALVRDYEMGDITFLLRVSYFCVFITHFLSFLLPSKCFNAHFL